MMRPAARADFTQLYHYQPFNEAYLVDLLRKKRIHCSDPSNLNDPWDCRPWFDLGIVDSVPDRTKITDWILALEPTSPVSPQQKAALRLRCLNDPGFLKEFLLRFTPEFFKLIPTRWMIYCLTPHPDSILMWSHYAANHTGICLEFACNNGKFLFGGACAVSYCSTYPAWRVDGGTEETLQDILLSKANVWSYEDEYRIIGRVKSVDAQPGEADWPLVDGGFMNLPEGALTSVITGCESNHDTIGAIVRECAPGMAVKRAIRSLNRFSLQIAG